MYVKYHDILVLHRNQEWVLGKYYTADVTFLRSLGKGGLKHPYEVVSGYTGFLVFKSGITVSMLSKIRLYNTD